MTTKARASGALSSLPQGGPPSDPMMLINGDSDEAAQVARAEMFATHRSSKTRAKHPRRPKMSGIRSRTGKRQATSQSSTSVTSSCVYFIRFPSFFLSKNVRQGIFLASVCQGSKGKCRLLTSLTPARPAGIFLFFAAGVFDILRRRSLAVYTKNCQLGFERHHHARCAPSAHPHVGNP